jgi:hydroxyacylglutathione hydrolase
LFEGTAQQMVQSLEKLSDLPNETQVYCGHEYTLDNIRFARVVEPGNQALIEREKTVENLRRQNYPTLPSTIALEKATNPFLRCSQPEIIRNASRHPGKALTDSTDLTDPVHVFAAIREWKNSF